MLWYCRVLIWIANGQISSIFDSYLPTKDQYFRFNTIAWVDLNGFSPNLISALILWRSDFGLLFANGQMSWIFDRVVCLQHDNGGVLSFHIFFLILVVFTNIWTNTVLFFFSLKLLFFLFLHENKCPHLKHLMEAFLLILLVDNECPGQTVDAQADLGLCCPHMHKEMFSHGAAQMDLKICLPVDK